MDCGQRLEMERRIFCCAKISANSLMQWMKSDLVSYFYTYVG